MSDRKLQLPLANRLKHIYTIYHKAKGEATLHSTGIGRAMTIATAATAPAQVLQRMPFSGGNEEVRITTEGFAIKGGFRNAQIAGANHRT